MTLRRRVLGYLALAAIASCALTVGVGVVLVRHQIASQRMNQLELAATSLAGGAAAELRGQGVYRTGTKRSRVGPALRRLVLAAVPSAGEGQGTTSLDGRSLLYAARQTDAGGRVILIRSASFAFAEWRPFVWSLLLAGLGGALLAVLLSYLLARRLTRPIGELAAATRRVARGETQVEVPAGGDDELSRLAGDFNEMSLQLTAARESERHFLESVSHELKTPLTSIRGYAEALEEEAVAPAEGARVIAGEADRLQRLVGDLLDLARFGRAGFSVTCAPIDLGQIAELAVARHLPRARELSIRLSAVSETGARGLGDQDRVLQATSNLIENALRLTPPGGAIAVVAARGEIAVRDTGPGLDPGDVPHAFERFYLYDRYRSERPVGTGLGLAIVRELVQAMGGSVQASSVKGAGAEFRLRVPAAPALRDLVRDQTRADGDSAGI